VRLTIAADEWRLDSLGPSQPTRLSPHPDHAVGDERACLALQLQLLRRGPLEEGRDLPLRRGTHEHRPRRSRRLEPSGRVHRVTRRAVSMREPAPTGPSTSSPLSIPTRTERPPAVGSDFFDDPQARAYGSLGIVLVRQGHSEK
jgi:hypothetical protein